jgi:DUF4097 and DUF4098 domain-containing protein YvlB
LELESFQGTVVVRTWDRDAVQLQARHSASYAVDIHRSESTIHVEPELERGFNFTDAVDFEIRVPRAFGINIEGMALNVDVEGSEGSVEIGTVHGNIRVLGGRESIAVESVNGEIHLEGAQGDMDVTGVAGGVTILDCSGDIYAESVGGALTLEGVSSSDVEVGTVGGSLRYEGSIEDGGTYNFGSHGGEIWLYLPANINAEVEVVTLAGDIEVDYPGAPSEPEKSEGFPGLHEKELSFELGTGSAQIVVETFGGMVRIFQQGG